MDASILNNQKLREILGRHAPGVDADDDGVFATPWRSTETFYRHTEEYVQPEKRPAYKRDLETAFPGKSGVL